MVQFKAQDTQRPFPPKYNGNQGDPEYFCTFRSLEMHSQSDPKLCYKNFYLFGHPVENSIIFLLANFRFPFFNEKLPNLGREM